MNPRGHSGPVIAHNVIGLLKTLGHAGGDAAKMIDNVIPRRAGMLTSRGLTLGGIRNTLFEPGCPYSCGCR